MFSDGIHSAVQNRSPERVPLGFAFHNHESKKALFALMLWQRGGRWAHLSTLHPPTTTAAHVAAQQSSTAAAGKKSKGLVGGQAGGLPSLKASKDPRQPKWPHSELLPNTSEKAFYYKEEVHIAMSLLPLFPTSENQPLTGIAAPWGRMIFPCASLSPTQDSVIQQPETTGQLQSDEPLKEWKLSFSLSQKWGTSLGQDHTFSG